MMYLRVVLANLQCSEDHDGHRRNSGIMEIVKLAGAFQVVKNAPLALNLGLKEA